MGLGVRVGILEFRVLGLLLIEGLGCKVCNSRLEVEGWNTDSRFCFFIVCVAHKSLVVMTNVAMMRRPETWTGVPGTAPQAMHPKQ